jgi:hypothetical protein
MVDQEALPTRMGRPPWPTTRPFLHERLHYGAGMYPHESPDP